MGLSVATQSTFKYVLEQHRTLPESKQPFLVFRFLSARDCSKMERIFDETRSIDDLSALTAKAIEAISIGLVGWSGFDMPFNVADIDAVLTPPDCVELRVNLFSQMSTSLFEKKASALRQLSTLAKSASNETASA